MASEASPLENDLVAFVEGHPETFSKQDVVNLRRNIIASFALMEGIHNESKPGVGHLASIILEKISEKIKDKPINTSQDVTFALNKFYLCGDFLNRFLTPLCMTQVTPSWNTREPAPIPPSQLCLKTNSDAIQRGGNIWSIMNRNIGEYHVRVLKLWADILVHYDIIKTEAITDAQTAGYDVKYNQFREKAYSQTPYGISDLDDSVLLEYLTLVHVATPAQMLAHPGQVTHLVFGVISQFVPLVMENGIGISPPDAIVPTGKHNSELKLNMMRVTCHVVEKPYPRTPGKPSEIEPGFVQSPIMAYLSCDTLDKLVQSTGHFPTTEEVLQARIIEKMGAAAFAPSPSLSTPQLSELGGGKKTRRKENKKRKYFKKSHRRFYRY